MNYTRACDHLQGAETRNTDARVKGSRPQVPWVQGPHPGRKRRGYPDSSAGPKAMPKTVLRIIFYLVICLQLKLWEFKINVLARELLIDTRKCFNLREKR